MQYDQSGERDPILGSILKQVSDLLNQHGLGGLVVVTDGVNMGYYADFAPDWSHIIPNPVGDGTMSLSFKKSETEEDRALAAKSLGVPVNLARGFFSAGPQLEKVITLASHGLSLKVTEEREDAPPDILLAHNPPATFDDAISLLIKIIPPDLKQMIQTNPGLAHQSFGQHLFNSWSLGEDTPFRRNFQERFGLFGHPNDMVSFILGAVQAVWMNAELGPVLHAFVEKASAIWTRQGINPATGGKL